MTHGVGIFSALPEEEKQEEVDEKAAKGKAKETDSKKDKKKPKKKKTKEELEAGSTLSSLVSKKILISCPAADRIAAIALHRLPISGPATPKPRYKLAPSNLPPRHSTLPKKPLSRQKISLPPSKQVSSETISASDEDV